MEYMKKMIWGPDPKEQARKCNALVRQNKRQLEREISSLNTIESKTKNYIKQAAKRNDRKSVVMFAKELYNIRKNRSRLYKSKAQLESVGMQINESFSMQKIQGTMKSSTGIMKEVNMLVRMPELTGTMRMLERELMKAGIMGEMVGDVVDGLGEDEMMEEDEEEQINDIIKEYLPQEKEEEPTEAEKLPHVPSGLNLKTKLNDMEVPNDAPADDNEELLSQMRERLKALQS